MLPLLLLLPGTLPAPVGPTAEVRLTVATIHAAALTTARGPDDAQDGPYVLVSMLGPGSTTATGHLPAGAHLTIRQDQALEPQPLVTLSLEPGDSIRLLVSLLEADQVELPAESLAANGAAAVLAQPAANLGTLLAPALAPVTRQGAHWLGSVALLLTNEGGTPYWRAFNCVATCKVLQAPGTAELAAKAVAPLAGVVEFSGDGGTYHLKLQGERAP